MKKKFSIWLNIVTICLCVCAIAIGVYAATTASLKVSGNIGFKAHGCEVSITDYVIQNASRDKTVTEPQDITTYMVNKTETAFPTSTGMPIGENAPFDFGAIYFVDNTTTGEVADIVVKFTITNSSAFNVKATVTNATSANSNITVTAPESVVFGTDTDTKTKDITITMSLAKQNGEYVEIADLSNISISISFAKEAFKSGIVVKKFDDAYATTVQNVIGDVECCETISYTGTIGKRNYVQAFPYYIEMGIKDSSEIKWLIVGVDNNGVISALQQEDKDAFAQGKMLNKSYYVLSEKTLENKAFDSDSNEYVTSDIRTYLIGDFISTYGFTQDDLNKIQKRSVKQMYATDTIREDKGEQTTLPNGQTFPSGTEDAYDYFWLLSVTEVLSIFTDDTVICSSCNMKVFMSGRTTNWGATALDDWWLRSIDEGYEGAYPVTDGTFDYRDIDNSGFAMRPAFKI